MPRPRPRPRRRVQKASPKDATEPASAPPSIPEAPNAANEVVKFTSRTCKKGVKVPKDGLFRYSPIARSKLEKLKKERDGSWKYQLGGCVRDEVAIELFAEWLLTQTLSPSSYLTHADSLIIESVAGNKRRSMEVDDEQQLVAQLWMIAKEFEIRALQNVADLQLRRMARKYRFLSPFVIIYDDYQESSELRAICTDIWSCLLLEKDGVTSEDVVKLRKDLASTGYMENGAQEQVLAEVVAVMLERCSRPENIWDRDDGSAADGR